MSEYIGQKSVGFQGRDFPSPDYVSWLEKRNSFLEEQLTASRALVTTLNQRVIALQEREAARARRELDSLPHFDRD